MGWALNANARTLLSVALIWLAGFFATRATKPLRLPNVTGYILAGVAIGPYALNLIPAEIASAMEFMTDAALSFIAFGVGRYLRADAFRRGRGGVVRITVCESLTAALLVTLTMRFVFRLPLSFSLLLGAIGSATAPTSSLMTIRQYRARGPFVDTLVRVVAIDDAAALIAFSVCAAVAGAAEAGGITAQVVLVPLARNLLGAAVAALLAWLLGKLVGDGRSREHRLTLACAFIFLLAALCAAMEVSPLLPCMIMGALYANLRRDKSLFKQLNRFTPPLLMMFFVLSGMRLNVAALKDAGLVGVAYFLARLAGKYLGARFGATLARAPDAVRRYLGLALIPQASVSIALALLGARLLPEESGRLLSTVILSSAVLYELIGPMCAKRALTLAGAIGCAKAAAKGASDAGAPFGEAAAGNAPSAVALADAAPGDAEPSDVAPDDAFIDEAAPETGGRDDAHE